MVPMNWLATKKALLLLCCLLLAAKPAAKQIEIYLHVRNQLKPPDHLRRMKYSLFLRQWMILFTRLLPDGDAIVV